jgi:hypothetical protein
MKIDSVFSQATLGIQRGIASASRHAADIASVGQINSDSPTSMVESMVGLRQDELQVQASAQVLKAYDAMIGSLFDEKA